MPELLHFPPQGRMVAQYARRGDTGQISLADNPNPASDNDALRRELLERSRRHEAVELEIVAQTYMQSPDITNSHFIDFAPEALDHLAATAADTPFCRDHSLGTDDQGGYALRSTVERDGGAEMLHERISLRKPFAVQAALEQLMKRFSISIWAELDDIHCTVCQAPMLECDHWPGDETDSGLVIFRHFAASWRERSWVVRSSVGDTGLLSWQQLSELRPKERAARQHGRSRTRLSTHPVKPRKPMNELFTLFNLSEDADPAVLTEKVRAKLSALEAAEAKAADLVAERDAAMAERDAAVTELAERREADLKAEAEITISALLADARIRPGGQQEALLRARFADGDVSGARSLAAAFGENARVAPVGGRQSSESPAASEPAGSSAAGDIDYQAAFAALPEHLRKASAKLSDNPQRLFELHPELLERVGQ